MQRFALFVILGLVACSRSASPPKPPATTAPEPVTATAVVEEEEVEEADPECTRYHELFARLDACPQLSEEDRQQLVQQDTDMLASRSESGMDGSSPYDTERGCEEGTAFLLRVAAKPCGWPAPNSDD